MMAMPRCGPRSSLPGSRGLSWTHAHTVLLLVVVAGRVAWGGVEPDLNRRSGSIGQRHAVPSAPHRSCMEILNSTIPDSDGFFDIDPDGPSGAPPFQVFCQLSTTHDNQGTTVVRTLDGNPTVQGNSRVIISYDDVRNKNSIRALIDISDRCRQHLKYECKGAPMWLNGVQQVAWESWNGRLMPNWGGVETGHEGCACSLNASCAGGGNCNCDLLSPPVYDLVDSGYITDKDTLPVNGLDFNYRGHFGSAQYTVGALECFGHRTTPPSTTEVTSTQESSTIPTTEVTSTQESSTIPTTEVTSTQESSTIPTTEVTSTQESSTIPTTEVTSTQESSTIPTTEVTSTQESPTIPTTEVTPTQESSTIPTTELTPTQESSTIPTTELTPTQESSTIPTTEVTSTPESSTIPTTTDRATTVELTISPEPPTTATEELMTSVRTQPVTSSTTTASIMTSIDDVLQATIPTISEVASTRKVTTAGKSSSAKAATSSVDPKSSKSSPMHDSSDPDVVFSEIKDALDERLELFHVLPGNTPIESLNNVSKDILDKTFGHLSMQDDPAIVTEMAVTTLLENNLAKIVGGLRHNETLQVTTGNTIVEAKSFSTSEDFGGYVFKAGHSKMPTDEEEDDSGATLEISTGSTEDISGPFSVLVVYRESSNTSDVADLVEDEGSSSNGRSYVDSGILTCSVLAQGEPLEIALKFSLRHKPYSLDGGKTMHRLCSFWNNSQKVWSTKGCKTQAPDSTLEFTTCSCNHNTSFAVLLRVTDSPVSQQGIDDSGTTLLGIILGSLSILCLCMGLALYTYLRLFKFLQIKVHANLMGSLLIGQIMFLTGIDATEYPAVCKGVTVLVQFFFSATFCWMLIEGGLLFQRAKMVSKQQPKILILMLIGWGVPFLITMISFAIGFQNYGTESVCWLSLKRGQIWAFLFLVIIVILVNLVIIILVMRTFLSLKMNTDKDNADKIRASFRALVVLVPILGLTWVFGFLQNASVVFSYLFVIFNSSQGTLIFICHVLMNSEVQKAFKRRGKNKVSASTNSSCDQSHTQMTTRKTNTTSATAF